MLDAHAHVMQVKLCKANTRGVTSTWLWYELWSARGMVMARWGFLDDVACLLVKDRVSVVVCTNIKLYRPLIANGGDKPSN